MSTKLSAVLAQANMTTIDGHTVNQYWQNCHQGKDIVHALASGALYLFEDIDVVVTGEGLPMTDLLSGGKHQIEMFTMEPMMLHEAPVPAPAHVVKLPTLPTFTLGTLIKHFAIDQIGGSMVHKVTKVHQGDNTTLDIEVGDEFHRGVSTETARYKLAYVGPDLVTAWLTQFGSPAPNNMLLKAHCRYHRDYLIDLCNRMSLDKLNGTPILEWSVAGPGLTKIKTADGDWHLIDAANKVIFEEHKEHGVREVWLIGSHSVTVAEFSERK